MTEPTLSRHLAHSTLEALKRAGHVLVARGETEQVLGDLASLIEPILGQVLPRVSRSPIILGEVTSTFGDEATDEAVETLVERMREALLDSDGVEDVFADDRTIERALFKSLADGLRDLQARAEELAPDAPPISVRLETLGYIAAAASRSADQETLKEALERAGEAAKSELDTYDSATRTAFFIAVDEDPERRIEIESAIEEELSDLVDMGMLALPTVERKVSLGRALDRAEQRSLGKQLDALAQKHLSDALCPGSWEWTGAQELKLVFTPLAETAGASVDHAAASFGAELLATVHGGLTPAALPPPRPALRAERPMSGALGLIEAVMNAKPARKAAGTSKAAPAKAVAAVKKKAARTAAPKGATTKKTSATGSPKKATPKKR